MTVSMYDACVPSILRMCDNLSAILKKAESFAEAKKIDPSVLLNSRLAPDMFALTRQVQIVSDTAKGAAARLTGSETPSFADTESSFADLHARIQKTVDFVKSLAPAKFDGSATRDIALKAGPRELKFKGQDYLFSFVLPNIYFHTTAAYAILRHNGVDVGKMDYLGAIQ